jgi:glycine/D-amino acid oxidase-like deaminating enzyme
VRFFWGDILTPYDCVVIGAGFTGSALAYELAKVGARVLLLDQDRGGNNATRYSYGGLAYWSGTDSTTKALCQEGMEIHRQLSQELGHDTQFREIDLLLTIPQGQDPQEVFWNYQHFAVIPELLSPETAAEVEPLLNKDAIAGVLKLPHAHIHAQETCRGYQKALQRLGGVIAGEKVRQIRKQEVVTAENSYRAAHIIVAAGGVTRQLLQECGIKIPQYFTYAQLLLTPPVPEIQLKTLIMSAIPRRLQIEKALTQPDEVDKWDQPSSKVVGSALEAGAIQFLDGSFCLGQLSQIIRNPHLTLDAQTGEQALRQAIAEILPALGQLRAQWYQCLVAFAADSRPLVGAVNEQEGLYVFSGFTSTLIFAPPLARQFAQALKV